MDFLNNLTKRASGVGSTQKIEPTTYTEEFKTHYEFMKNLECATKELTTNFMIQLQPTTAGRRKFSTVKLNGEIYFINSQ